VAGCLVGLFVWLLWPRPVTPTAFASIVVSDVDAGQLTVPAFAEADVERLAKLPWTQKVVVQDRTFNADAKTKSGPSEGVLFCYVAGQLATRLVDGAPQLALLSTDFSEARLADFVNSAPNGPATPVRELLQSIATQPYATKIVLLDSPRASAEPWLAVSQADWAATLRSDVEAVESDNLWVICAGPDNTQSRINHRSGGSVFMEQVGEVLREQHDANENGFVDLQDLTTQLTETLGAEPAIVTRSKTARDVIVLPLEFTQAAAKVVEPAPETKQEEEDAADKPAEPAKPAEAKGDPVWLAHDSLQDLGTPRPSPVDYAPASWRELQQVLVWSDWRRHTRGGDAEGGALETSFLAAKEALALAGDPRNADFTDDALKPFPDAIRNFQNTRLASWQDAPPTYLTAVRRRNLLLSRLPDYWRWKAACGEFEAQTFATDLGVLKTLCTAIQNFEGQADRSRAEDIPRQAKEADVVALLDKVTTDIQQELTTLYTNYEGAKAAPLPAAIQHRIEQLLLTPLPSAVDRERLWKVLKEVDIAPSVGDEKVAIAMPTSVAGDQAELEANWAEFTAGWNQSGDDDEKLPEVTTRLKAAAAVATNAQACAEFVRQLSEYCTLLKSQIQTSPRSGDEELLARAGDAQLERDDSDGGMAPLGVWKQQLVVDLGATTILDFSSTVQQTLTLSVRGASAGNTTLLRLTDIPPQVKLTRGESPVTTAADIAYTGQPVTVNATYQGEPPANGTLHLVVIAESASPGRPADRSPDTKIAVTLPVENVFELVRLDVNSLVREAQEAPSEADRPTLPGVRLLAHPNDDSVYDIGLRQTAGPRAEVQVELYALKNEWSTRGDVPLSFDALRRDAVKLPVGVTVGPSGDVRPLTFSLNGPPPTAAGAPTDAAAPPPAPPKELPLPSLQLVAVISETKPGGGVDRHLQWLGVEPLHPDQFVDAEALQPVENNGAQRLPFALKFATNPQSPIALPRGPVEVKLGATDDLIPAVKGLLYSDTALPVAGLTPSLDFNAALAENGDGLVYLDIANYPRAFIWQFPDDRDVSRNAPTPFPRERIYIRAPRASTSSTPLPGQLQFVGKPTTTIDVLVEVDNVSGDRTVEIGLRDANGKVIDSRQVRGSRRYRPSLKVEEETGRLIIRCDVSDFQVMLDPRGTDGEAEIYAEVLAANRTEAPTQEDVVLGVLDGTGPRLPDVDPDVPVRVRSEPGKPIVVTVTAEDLLSGPKKIEYWQTEPPVITDDVAEPKGKELLPVKTSANSPSYTVRDFKFSFKELDPGDNKIYLRAQDFAGNWSKLTSFVIDHESAMAAEAEKVPVPRDVRIKVTYKRGSEQIPVRNPTATIMGPGDQPGATEKGDTQGVIVLKQLPPGPHKVVIAGRPRNAGEVKKDHTIEVPDDGKKTPIEEEVSLD
jgi:hypothetical protein